MKTPLALLVALFLALTPPLATLAADSPAGPVQHTDSGLTYQDLVVGTGPVVKNGQTVTVGYVGTLSDGTVFDRSGFFKFVVGGGGVIKGWDEGVAGMNVGGRRKLVIPPQLAYGDRGAGGVIPPNATLTFVIDLKAAK